MFFASFFVDFVKKSQKNSGHSLERISCKTQNYESQQIKTPVRIWIEIPAPPGSHTRNVLSFQKKENKQKTAKENMEFQKLHLTKISVSVFDFE